MLDETPYLNRSHAVVGGGRWRLMLPLTIVLMLAIAAGAVNGAALQKSQRRRGATTKARVKAPSKTSARAPRVTGGNARRTASGEFVRPRRTLAPVSPTASSSPAATKTPAVAPSTEHASEEMTTVSREDAELAELRAEISAAEDGQERARLQRKLVDRLIELNRKVVAIDELRVMAKDERFDPTGFYNLGNTLAQLGDANGAVDAYRKAISQRRGNYARAQNNLGVVLIRLGRWEEAAAALDSAVKQENGAYAEARFNLGRVHWLRGEAKSAIKEWERTLKLQPEHVGATVALARAYAEAGDAQRGLKMLDDFSSRMSLRAAVVPREIVIVRGEIVAAANASGAENNRRPTLITERSSGNAPAARVGNNTGRDQQTQAGTSPAP